MDLPGVGGSTDTGSSGSKRHLAATVHQVVEVLGLTDFALVGHDVGGMVAYAYLRGYVDAVRVVIVETVVPGVDPWERVLANPYIWHFAFHAIPKLPERLVQGHQAEYFAFFYDTIAANPSTIGREVRATYAEAYRSEASLGAGFDFYRAFPQDARDNRELGERGSTRTPLLYVRGGAGRSDIDADVYAAGLRRSGVEQLSLAVVPDAGHFIPEEAPAALWSLIKAWRS
jgi:pimeloyl-ACP methyl ester carboxylesterase